jgi:hypothetical protein
MRKERMDGIASASRDRLVQDNVRLFKEMKAYSEEVSPPPPFFVYLMGRDEGTVFEPKSLSTIKTRFFEIQSFTAATQLLIIVISSFVYVEEEVNLPSEEVERDTSRKRKNPTTLMNLTPPTPRNLFQLTPPVSKLDVHPVLTYPLLVNSSYRICTFFQLISGTDKEATPMKLLRLLQQHPSPKNSRFRLRKEAFNPHPFPQE